MQKVSINLWFDKQAEEAAKFYASLIPNSKIGNVTRFPEGIPAEFAPGGAGSVMTAEVHVNGIDCVFLNGGPGFKLNEAFSFILNVDGQEEVDKYWNALIADGGEESQCGWLKDKFGVSWQVIPKKLYELTGGSDKEAATRATNAMLQMQKIIVADLQKAYDNR